MSFPGSAEPVYLNIMLDTKSLPDAGIKHSSWGQVTAKQLPTVWVYAVDAGHQVLEGGETPGYFSISRINFQRGVETIVHYELKIGDGPWVPGTHTISGREWFEVPAPAAGSVGADKTIRLRIKDDPSYLVATRPGQTREASIQVIQRKRLLLTYTGLGDSGPVPGNDSFGASYVRRAHNEAKILAGLGPDEELVLKHVAGTRGMRWIFEGVNQDDDPFISEAEAEAATVVLSGYSMGGVTAFNTAHRINVSHKQFSLPGRKSVTVKAPVPVQMLAAVDPVGRPTARSFATTQKPANVQMARAWYQKRRGPEGFYFEQWEQGGIVHTESHKIGAVDFSRLLTGGPIPGGPADNVVNINVTTHANWQHQPRGYTRVQGGIEILRFLERGAQVQHNSIGLYVYGANLGEPVDNDESLPNLLRTTLGEIAM